MMQLHFLSNSKVMMIGSLLVASTFQTCFAQPSYDNNRWINSDYGIHGRPDGKRDFCHWYEFDRPVVASGPAPTIKEAAESFVCNEERLKGQWGPLILIDPKTVKITIGTGRPFDKIADAGYSSIDQSALIYPLHGDFTLYDCVDVKTRPEGTHSYKVGENCNSIPQQATGACIRLSEVGRPWHCNLSVRIESYAQRKESDSQWTLGVAPPDLPQPKPEEEGAGYFVNDALPFITTLQPMEKQVGKGSVLGTHVTITYQGASSAIRLKATSVPEFRIKPRPGGSAQGMLVRFTVDKGVRTLGFDQQDGKVMYETIPTVQSKSELIGPSIRISVSKPLAPGEYGLFYETFGTLYAFGVD